MKRNPCDTTKQQAIDYAERAANEYCLPQTIYRNADSGGWWHTHFAANLLAHSKTQLFVTLLPKRYFS